MAKTPTWQRAEGKNPEGGLNEKGRASLRAAGHDIKRPQPEGGPRKDSFCARMKGMKAKNTSSETANDPDSRINKSLRKWNCADGGAVDPYDSVQQAAKGGPIWDKPRPKKLGKPEPLSSKEKASAKAAAKAAGRPYPNLIDNMRAARADGGELDPYEAVQSAANTDGGMGNFSAEDIQRASHGATPAVPSLTVTENAQPSTPAADALRGAYNAAIPPTARLLAEGAMGVHSPITERDFSQSDIQNMKDRLVEQQQSNADREKNLQDIQNFMTPEKYRHYQTMTEQPIASDEEYRRFMVNNATKLQSFQDTRGQTSVPYGTTFGKEDQPNQPLSVYSPEQGGIANSINRSYNDPGYRTGMTLGRFNVYDTPQGRIAVDNYDFRGTKQSLSDIAKDFQTKPGVTALRGAIPTLLPNIERPVAINLDRPGNYTYTGKPILTPGSHLDPDQTATPRQDEIADYKTKTPGYWKFNWAAQQSRTPDVTVPLPPRRPAGYAEGGEVEGDVQFAPDDPYAKVQEAAKLPMMAQHEYAMRMPEPEVRYDTGPQPGEATLKAYDPTIKERIYQGIAGTEERSSPERAQFARGMSQMAEFAPVLGNVMAGQEAQRRGDTKGMLMAALPVPGMATEARMAEAAAGPAQQAAQEAYQRVLNAQGLYSHAAEAAANLPQAKGSYEQMMAMLQKAGVKPEEVRWSGVEQFAGQPVTREQLVSHFEQGVPKIEETVLGGPRDENLSKLFSVVPVGHGEFEVVNEAGRGITRYGSREMAEETAQRFNTEGLPSHLAGRGTIENPPKFEPYTIEGGQNYREVLLHMPSSGLDSIEQAELNALYKKENAGTITSAEGKRLQDLNYKDRNAPVFTSSHWDQPNVLGHLRLSDRTGPQGEKILHMEELQSDWGQAGRKQGFGSKKLSPDEEAEYFKLHGMMGSDRNEAQQARLDELVDKMNKASRSVPAAPYVESTKNWVDLGLKRALKEAAEKGYDKLVWTPGAEQAARYDLSKQVRNIEWKPYDERGAIKHVTIEPTAGNPIELPIDANGYVVKNVGTQFDGKPLDEIVGKDLAKQILNERHGELSGSGLNIGGEGMKSFYDSIIPSRLKELMKKIDPQAKVGTEHIKTGDEWPFSARIASDGESYWLAGNSPYAEGEQRLSGKFSSYADADKQRELLYSGYHKPVHSIQITPKMREAILKGLPAYAKGGEVVNDTDPYDNMRSLSKNFPRARRASH